MGKRRGPTHAVKTAFRVGKSGKWASKEVGVAFEEDDGSLTLKIHHGMALVGVPGVSVKVWPIDEKGRVNPGRKGRQPHYDHESPDEDFSDEDVPWG